jgi:hypothetical protein
LFCTPAAKAGTFFSFQFGHNSFAHHFSPYRYYYAPAYFYSWYPHYYTHFVYDYPIFTQFYYPVTYYRPYFPYHYPYYAYYHPHRYHYYQPYNHYYYYHPSTSIFGYYPYSHYSYDRYHHGDSHHGHHHDHKSHGHDRHKRADHHGKQRHEAIQADRSGKIAQHYRVIPIYTQSRLTPVRQRANTIQTLNPERNNRPGLQQPRQNIASVNRERPNTINLRQTQHDPVRIQRRITGSNEPALKQTTGRTERLAVPDNRHQTERQQQFNRQGPGRQQFAAHELQRPANPVGLRHERNLSMPRHETTVQPQLPRNQGIVQTDIGQHTGMQQRTERLDQRNARVETRMNAEMPRRNNNQREQGNRFGQRSMRIAER